MFCPNCGSNVGDSKFCPNCGTAVDPSAAPAQATPSAHVFGGKVVNKIAFALLAFFLGGFGIHRFYAGRTASGIVYLVFFWTFIPAILGLIECIVALVRESDANGNIRVDPNSFFI